VRGKEEEKLEEENGGQFSNELKDSNEPNENRNPRTPSNYGIGHTHDAAAPVTSFDDMGLSMDLLRGIYGYGFASPSLIQQRAIVPLSKGFDIIAQSQSGTGKTGAFTAGALARVDCSDPRVQALILEPTKELAVQTSKVMTSLGSFMGVVVQCSIGGFSVGKDIAAYRKGVHAVVGTPGRILDLIRGGNLSPARLKVLILDEADQMLSAGFLDAIRDIMVELPQSCQVGLFSATLPPETLEITTKFMKEPVKIELNREEVTLKGILQYYVDVGYESNKLECLMDLFNRVSVNQCVIFCNSRRRAAILTDSMAKNGFPVACIHSDLTPAERIDIMESFTVGNVRVLIATDLIARGIDVQGVEFVVNYDMTHNYENYVHRIGRCGRFGRKGRAINLITANERGLLRDLCQFYSTNIEPLPEFDE
jgi:translation initiation factor 4A